MGIAQPAPATVVFDDHFTGNSGGMPTGWSLVYGPGTAIEAGTTVTLDHDILISSNATVDPSSGTMTITWDIAWADPSLILLNDATSGDLASSGIDHITVDVEGATPVESMTLGHVKALYGR